MKKIKLFSLTLLVFTLLTLLSLPTFAAEAQGADRFPDVNGGDWFYATVDRLTKLGAIDGMPDGKFYPNNNITRAEFVKIVVSTTINDDVYVATSHWAGRYIIKAEEKGILQPGEFADDTWDRPILRQEMAIIIARTLEFVLNEDMIADTTAHTTRITDWASTCTYCQPYIAQAYAKAIITGMPDGSFQGTKQATRAEAATMIVRLIDPAYRVQSNTPFNPLTDVAADGRMKLAKAEEYMMMTMESLKFYQEGGKFYVKGDLPTLPEGFENWLDITVQFKRGTGLSLAGCSTYTFIKDDLIASTGTFAQEIKGMTSVSQVEVVHIKVAVNALDTTNDSYEKFEGHWSISSLNKDEIALIDSTNHNKQTNKYYDFSKLFTW